MKGSHSEAHTLMREVAILLGWSFSDLETREKEESLEITLTDKKTNMPLAELSRLQTSAAGPNPWQASYSMDRVAVVPNLASKVEALLASAGYSYESLGYKGLAIYTRDAHAEQDEAPPPRGAAEWLGQPIQNTGDLAKAVFGAAMMSVRGAQEILTDLARGCRKDLNSMQMEALYLALLSARWGLSMQTADDEKLRVGVLREFDALVAAHCAKKEGFERTLSQRKHLYLLALVPGVDLASTIGQEYAKLCGCEGTMAVSVGASFASITMDTTKDVVGVYRGSQHDT